jgi:hypothetical protein
MADASEPWPDYREYTDYEQSFGLSDAPEKPSFTITASPYIWRDPETIPPRPWVYGRWLLRGTIACVVAPGGAGKSTILAGLALAMVTGRALLGKETWHGPKRVWLWNLEDDLDELSRSIQAAAKHHGIERREIEQNLFVDSAMEGAGLCTAIDGPDGFQLLEPVYDALTAELILRSIDVLVVDPFISSHGAEENHNTKIDAIAKAWARVAKAANCCIVLSHHTSKAGAGEVTALSSRGAVALPNAARTTLVINRMEKEQAERLGIADDERRRYISVGDDKHNRAPAEKADWYRLASVDLGNGGDDPSDNVAVAEPWKLPDPFDGLSTYDLTRVQEAIAGGEWRADVQASAWAGRAVASALGLDVEVTADKARIKSLLKTWIDSRVLRVIDRDDDKRRPRKWIEVGDPVDAAPPRQRGAEQGGAG